MKRNALYILGWLIASAAIYAVPFWFLGTQSVSAPILIIQGEPSVDPADVTAPTMTSANVDATGLIFTAMFSENVTADTATGWSLDSTGGDSALTHTGGSGTNTHTFSIDTRTIDMGETVDVDYDSGVGSFNDPSSNALATITNGSVSNNSVQGSESWDFEDSFEGTNPTGWSGTWAVTAASPATGFETTTETAPPTGGGSNTLAQRWEVAAEWNTRGGAQYSFSPTLSDGDVITLEYSVYYDASFDPGSFAVVKHWILQSDSDTDDRIYIEEYGNAGGGTADVFLQGVYAGGWNDKFRRHNVNGGEYDHPEGQWVKYKYEIKLGGVVGAPGTGYIKGWIDDVYRMEHLDISTHDSGNITVLKTNATINGGAPEGPNQNRWLDLFKIKVDYAP